MTRTPRLKVPLADGARAELAMVADLLGVPHSTAGAVLIECGLTVRVEDLFEAKRRLEDVKEFSGPKKCKRA